MIIEFKDLESLKNQKLVYAGGFFDLFHVGHLRLLNEIKCRFPDHKLIVGVASDKRAKLKKENTRPIITQSQRMEIVDSIRCVDYVFLLPFRKSEVGTIILAIKKMKPEIIISSKPKTASFIHEAHKNGTKIVTIHRHGIQSTSKIINKILSTNEQS